MGPDLHHMAAFILYLKMWHLCQNSLCADMKSASEKCPLMYVKSEMYPFQMPSICDSHIGDIRQ